MIDNYEKIFQRYSGSKNNYFKEDKSAKNKYNLIDDIEKVKDKEILEFGAGGSSYCKLFLDYGCNAYHGIDIIKDRLLLLPNDKRITKYHGDFLEIDKEFQVDILFSALTMMILIPQHKRLIKKIHESLKVGGYFIGYEANYLCPYSFYKLYLDREPNPASYFNPFSYAKIFEDQGFKVEALKPVLKQRDMKFLWPLATAFMIKARKL